MLDCVKIDANLHIFSNLTKCEATGISYLNQAFCLDFYANPILFVCKMHGFWSCEWRCKNETKYVKYKIIGQIVKE